MVSKLGSVTEATRYNTIFKRIDDEKKTQGTTFDTLFQSAMDMVNETNDLTNAAEEQEINYALGTSTSTHDLMVAQQKANISLQYTVAVRNGVLDAYKEIMNLQF
ncbi:MAG: flagellar hook-basal body complex protein FliE [Lachnospiraceae bacterium]|nr:flagellar hook-basal body complex protein FliE [Lachnospiraceae bacterium]